VCNKDMYYVVLCWGVFVSIPIVSSSFDVVNFDDLKKL
jgi:hypothetical protein